MFDDSRLVQIGNARETRRPLEGYTVPCTARLIILLLVEGGKRGMKGEKDGEGVGRKEKSSLVPRPHPLTRRNGLVNQVEFLGLAHAFATL